MTQNTSLMLTTSIDFNDRTIVQTLKTTVAQGLTDPEFMLFAEHCKATKLNPFKKEVWAIKAGNRLQIMTGINGFLAIANNHPEFDGMEVEVDDDAKPTKATCKVYRKDRKFPAVGVALLKEYGKDTPIWKQMPRVMLTKVAKSIAIREAFPQELNGIYTAEEMPPTYGTPDKTETTIEAKPTEYLYDLSVIEAETFPAARDYVEKAGGSLIRWNVYKSSTLLPKLGRALMNEVEVAEFWERFGGANDAMAGGNDDDAE